MAHGQGQLEVVKLLLQRGASLHTRTTSHMFQPVWAPEGATPLYLAAVTASSKLCLLLLHAYVSRFPPPQLHWSVRARSACLSAACCLHVKMACLWQWIIQCVHILDRLCRHSVMVGSCCGTCMPPLAGSLSEA